LPLGNRTDLAFAPFALDLDCHPSTLIESPVFTVVFFHPALVKALIVPSSNSQLTVLPVASLASTKTRACGLPQSTFVTVPATVTGFFQSYSASHFAASSASSSGHRMKGTFPSTSGVFFLYV
jgi:hypothetical protein